MQSILAFEIREQLARYLVGEISLDEFRQWFVPAAWELEASDDVVANELSNQIFLSLAEYSNGDWTEAELNQLFRHLVASGLTQRQV